ncbi:hypothetical protein ALC62_01348 [Cyphomyrmex costatus]|uniref:Uncharacterized protein n=1 Tax=Cyphomyrmex costatus TaxID=456900 RepID=A0A151IPA2_9HYME|nr:hypothetical protein ALC62_01348 [Cyphomyrmex costatus]
MVVGSEFLEIDRDIACRI